MIECEAGHMHYICLACMIPSAPEACLDVECTGRIHKITPHGFNKKHRTSSQRYPTVIITEPPPSLIIKSPDGECTSIEIDNGEPLSSEDKDALLSLFMHLHTVLVTPEQSHKRVNVDEDLAPGTVDDKIAELMTKDNSFLLKCIENLALGKKTSEYNQNSREKYQCYSAKENITRATNNHGSGLRAVMGSWLAMHSGSRSIQTLLSRLGICHSNTVANRNASINYVHDLSQSVDMKDRSHDLPLMAYDNIGFRWRKGYMQKKSYMPYTLIKIIFVPFEELQRDGIYPDPRNPENLLSWERERGDWDDISDDEETTVEEIMFPKDLDYQRLSNISNKLTCIVLSNLEKGILPTVNQAKQLLQNSEKIVTYVSTQDELYTSMENGVSDVTQYNEHIIFDNPMHKDLSKKDTVKELLLYCEQVLNELKSCTNDKPGIDRRIIDRICMPFCGDGQPTNQAMKLQASDISFNELDVQPFSGGFHMMLELFKMMGKLFYETHLYDIIHCWRTSEKQVSKEIQHAEAISSITCIHILLLMIHCPLRYNGLQTRQTLTNQKTNLK